MNCTECSLEQTGSWTPDGYGRCPKCAIGVVERRGHGGHPLYHGQVPKNWDEYFMAIGRNTCLHGEDCPACAKDRAIAERAEGDGQLVMLEWSVAQDDDLTGSDSEGGAVL